MLSDFIKQVSYSSISNFLQCPRMWKLMYIDKLDKKQDSVDMTYGTIIHQTIQNVLKYYYSNSLQKYKNNKNNLLNDYTTIAMKGLDEGLNKELHMPYETIQQYLGYSIDLLKQFIPNIHKWFPKSGIKLEGTEVLLNTDIPGWNIKFRGYIDILLKDTKNNKYKIIDLKTSRTTWNDKQKNDETKRLQLLLYKIFLSQEKNIPLQNIDIEFLILKKILFQSQYKNSRIQKYQPPHGNVTINKARNLFNETLKEMQKLCESKQNGCMNPSNYCLWCPFNKEKELCNKRKTIK